MRRTTGTTVGLVLAGLLGSALTAVPAFFVDDVPAGAVGVAGFGIGVTLLAVALLAPALRQRDRVDVPAGVA